jgi:WD40-like Beta Propeller Repeat
VFELDSSVLDLDHPQTPGLVERRRSPERRVDDAYGGLSECRSCGQRPSCRARQPSKAFAEEPAKTVRDGERRVRRHVNVGLMQHAGDLEREEGVPAGRVVQADQRRMRECRTDMHLNDALQLTDAERRQQDPLEGFERHRGSRLIEAGASCAQKANGFILESSEGEVECPPRRFVEPRQVVDCDEHRPFRSDGTEHGQDCESNCPRIGSVILVVCPKERDIKRMALQLGQQGRRGVEDGLEEIRETDEPELCLGLDGTTRENSVGLRSRRVDALLPQRRLADSHLALEQESGWPLLHSRQEPLELRQLLPAADDGPRSDLLIHGDTQVFDKVGLRSRGRSPSNSGDFPGRRLSPWASDHRHPEPPGGAMRKTTDQIRGRRSHLLVVSLLTIILIAAVATVMDRPAQAAFPGLNGKIAFMSTRDGNGEIYVMNPDGSNQVNISHNSAFDEDPAWSPDGRWIAFGEHQNRGIRGLQGARRRHRADTADAQL